MKPPVIILVGTQHPGNAGAAARGAANFGVTDLRFVAPQGDVKGKEAQDRAVHAKGLITSSRIFPTLAAALEGISLSVGTTARSEQAPHRQQRKPNDIRDLVTGLAKWDGQVAYVFGNEASGLSSDEVNLLDQLVTIPTADYTSMNLAHAVTLVCYEHFRVAAASVTPERALNADALAALNKAWDSLVVDVDERVWRRKAAQAVWRKVLGRSLPDTYEVHNIMGILTNSLKRFGHQEYATANSDRALAEKGLKVPRPRLKGKSTSSGTSAKPRPANRRKPAHKAR